MDIKAPCKYDYYPAAHHSGFRPVSAIKLIVLHDEEASTARSAAAWFQNPDSKGSTQLCVDDNICYRCLANTMEPWGAHGANYTGFHIEQAGFARWSIVIWKKHLRTLQRAAYKTAFHAKKFGIPLVFLFAADLKAGKRGITTHAECTKAFGGSHTDPGPFWPRRLFMYYVRKYSKELL